MHALLNANSHVCYLLLELNNNNNNNNNNNSNSTSPHCKVIMICVK